MSRYTQMAKRANNAARILEAMEDVMPYSSSKGLVKLAKQLSGFTRGTLDTALFLLELPVPYYKHEKIKLLLKHARMVKEAANGKARFVRKVG